MFFWYQLTRVVPDKIHRAAKRLCVCVCVCDLMKLAVSVVNMSGNLFNSAQREIGRWKFVVRTFSACSKAQVSRIVAV